MSNLNLSSELNVFTDLTTPTVFEDPPGTPILNLPLPGPAVLDTTPGLSHTVTLLSDNGLASSYTFIDGFNTVYDVTSLGGGYIVPGDNPTTLFGPGPLADFFNNSLPLLPGGWTFYGGEVVQSDVIGGGPFLRSSFAFLSFDAGAAPVPLPPAILFLASGVVGLILRRRAV